MRYVRYIARRFSEPSTYAAIAALGAILGVEELERLSAPEIAGALAAIVAIFLGERPK